MKQLLAEFSSPPTMTDKRSLIRRRSSSSAIGAVVFSSCLAGRVNAADPMVPSDLLKKTHLAAAGSTTNNNSTLFNAMEQSHAERLRHRAQRHNEFRGGTYEWELPVTYGGRHPYELMEKDRIRKKARMLTDKPQLRRGLLKGGTYPGSWYEESWDGNGFEETDPESWYPNESTAEGIGRYDHDNFRPLRIKMDFSGLPADDPGSRKNRFIENTVMRAAEQFWSTALSVYPAQNIKVDPQYCFDLPPSTHKTQGVDDADLVLYVYGETYCGNGQMAAADGCSWDQYNRPVAGVVLFCLDSIQIDSNGQVDALTELTTIETAIHEIGHVLGLKSDEMVYYYDQNSGLPRTAEIEMTQGFECINGNKKDVYVPDENTLRRGSTTSGIEYYEVTTPTVKRVSQNHFNCDSTTGMRMENQPTNPNDCFGSHFEERLLWNGLLTALAETAHIPQYLTAFTLALLEDTGWYKASYSMTQNVAFGHGAGCDFVEKDCVDDGELVAPLDEFFCNEVDGADAKLGCDPDHSMIAACDLVDVSTADNIPEEFRTIPSEMQYFDDPKLGGKYAQTDYCPIYSTYIGLSCREEPQMNGFNENMIPGETFADNSRCFNSNAGRPLCLETVCNEETYKIDIIIDGETLTCEKDGEQIAVNSGGKVYTIECPRLAKLCPNLVCPSGCAGRGECLWLADNIPYCSCDDSNVDSANCNDLPPSILQQENASTQSTEISDNDPPLPQTMESDDEEPPFTFPLPGGSVEEPPSLPSGSNGNIQPSLLDASDAGGSVLGYTKKEQFMKCQKWCSKVPNSWSEKCLWTYSCGLCRECLS